MTDEELDASVTLRQLMLVATEVNKLKVELPGLIRQAIVENGRAASVILAANAVDAEQTRQQVLNELPSLVSAAVSMALAAALQKPGA